ncbi:MAG: GNAT family N-acetyltransferase [Haliea sp.]
MGRTWWWGPFVDDNHDWDGIADALWLGANRRLADAIHTEQELAVDSRSRLLAAFAARHGFHAEEGSACLILKPGYEFRHADADLTDAANSGVTIKRVKATWAPQVAALHDTLFPSTHRTGADIATSAGTEKQCLVALLDGCVIGYVATENQSDQSLYIDYVGVEPDYRGRGVGRALVATACQHGFAENATHAHLTVRESNRGARALYESLGFETEQILVPYRRGFALAPI